VHAHLDVRCPSRCLPSLPLDDLVWADLCDLLTHPTWLTQAFTRAQTGAWLPQALQARQANLRKADLKLAQQLDRLTQAYLENILALDEYRRRHTDLQAQRQALHDQAQQLNSQADRQLELTGYVHHLEDFCHAFKRRFTTPPLTKSANSSNSSLTAWSSPVTKSRSGMLSPLPLVGN
jgi:site-specific DNA recombinase